MRPDEVRMVLHLARQIYDESSSFESRVHGVLDALRELARAQVAISWLARDVLPDRSIDVLDLVEVGRPRSRGRAALRSKRHTADDHPVVTLARAVQYPAVLTRSREQLVGGDKGAEPGMYSVAALARPGWVHVLELYRPRDDARPFGSADLQLVQLLHTESVCLFERCTAYQRGARDALQLSPKLNVVVGHLLQGLSEKQIAQKLQVSVHTIHTHVGELYQRFGVHSRAEFMAQHLSAQGG